MALQSGDPGRINWMVTIFLTEAFTRFHQRLQRGPLDGNLPSLTGDKDHDNRILGNLQLAIDNGPIGEPLAPRYLTINELAIDFSEIYYYAVHAEWSPSDMNWNLAVKRSLWWLIGTASLSDMIQIFCSFRNWLRRREAKEKQDRRVKEERDRKAKEEQKADAVVAGYQWISKETATSPPTSQEQQSSDDDEDWVKM
ncbi:hypothetical protein B0T17DRAFT_507657 [Bombardia bombarda]|uniref:Uncharacterized protein n=1 Tax=Bombardia bombarda TaxID=252184 RepID=A0AA39WZQ7_9PEZI|nr:hypothetical protein B0T17DRAFT_507657 [Bombardia bombarda]